MPREVVWLNGAPGSGKVRRGWEGSANLQVPDCHCQPASICPSMWCGSGCICMLVRRQRHAQQQSGTALGTVSACRCPLCGGAGHQHRAHTQDAWADQALHNIRAAGEKEEGRVLVHTQRLALEANATSRCMCSAHSAGLQIHSQGSLRATAAASLRGLTTFPTCHGLHPAAHVLVGLG